MHIFFGITLLLYLLKLSAGKESPQVCCRLVTVKVETIFAFCGYFIPFLLFLCKFIYNFQDTILFDVYILLRFFFSGTKGARRTLHCTTRTHKQHKTRPLDNTEQKIHDIPFHSAPLQTPTLFYLHDQITMFGRSKLQLPIGAG